MDSIFREKITNLKELNSVIPLLRKVKLDSNTFYRCLSFLYLENLLCDAHYQKEIMSLIISLINGEIELINCTFENFTSISSSDQLDKEILSYPKRNLILANYILQIFQRVFFF